MLEAIRRQNHCIESFALAEQHEAEQIPRLCNGFRIAVGFAQVKRQLQQSADFGQMIVESRLPLSTFVVVRSLAHIVVKLLDLCDHPPSAFEGR